MNRQKAGALLIGLAFSACAAEAQTNATYFIGFEGIVSPQNPTMRVSLWAMWDDPGNAFVFGGTNFDLEAGDGVFSNADTPLNGLHGPTPVGNRIPNVATGQIHLPPIGIFGRRDNPILILTADWTTTDFSPRQIVFETSNTNNFLVADWVTGETRELYPQQFSPGRAVYVIPSPASLALLGVCTLVYTGRRRREW